MEESIKNINKNKGISLIALVIVIIIMLILTSSVIITTVNISPIEEANEAVIRSDIKTMQESYEIAKADAYVNNLGENSQITSSDFVDVIPDKYRNDFKALKDEIIYVGDNETVEKIAEEMGILKKEFNAIEDVLVETTKISANIETKIIAGEVIDEYIYQIRQKGEEEWYEFSSAENVITIENLVNNTEYEIKVIAKQGEKTYESEIIEVLTKKELVLGTLTLKINDESGEVYSENTWTNGNIYVEVAGENTTYKVTGANTVSETKAATILRQEGISTITLRTTSDDKKEEKTQDYVIKIDRSEPVVNELVSSNEAPTTENITLTGKAVDSLSGIVAYMFSNNGKITVESEGWTIIENTKEEVEQSYIVSENGTYYFYIKDEAGNVVKKEKEVNNIDRNGPVLESINVTAPESGEYLAGQEITIEAVYDEEIAVDNTVLKIKFGTSLERTLEKGEISGNKIIYKYVTVLEDVGELATTSYNGTVQDSLGNELTVSNMELTGNSIKVVYPKIRSWQFGASTEFHNSEYKSKITKVVLKDNVEIPTTAVASWDVSSSKNGSVMAYVEDNLNSGYILTIGGKGKIYANENSGNLFYNFTVLTEIENMHLFDTSKTAGMSNMFTNCKSLTDLDVSGFDTSNVTSMYNMFFECNSLTNIDVSNFNTSNVTNMGEMFGGCKSLTSLDVSGFDTSNVTYIGSMFRACNSVTSLDVSNFNTSNVTNMGGMFSGCSSLTSLDVSSFNTSSVNNMESMFNGCSGLTSLDVSKFDTINVTSMRSMFIGCKSLTSLDVSNFNTSSVTNMGNMFNGCSSLTSLDVSSFETSNVSSMWDMFSGCSSLTSLNVSNFDTSKVNSMSRMFRGCSGLTSLDISDFDTSNVKDMPSMFESCSSLTNLDVSKFSTDNVTNMWGLFNGCSSLTSLDLSNFNTSSVTKMGSTFSGCSSLTSLDISKFDTSNVSDMSHMFHGCVGITSLDLSKFNTSNVTTMEYMFYMCTKLQQVSLGANFSFLGNGAITTTNQYLPTHRSTNIEGADGKWYNTAGVGFASAEIPNNVADTYTAIKPPAIIQAWAENATTDFHAESYRTKITKAKFESSINVPEGATSWDVSDAGNGSVMAYVEDDGNSGYILTIAGNGKVYANEDSGYVFRNFTALTEIENVNLFDTSNATNMSNMFNGCSSLTSLDLSNFNTSNVTSMAEMIRGCSSLTSINFSSFNTSNVTAMNGMFSGCSSLTSIDVSGFDTSNVTTMESMFNGCVKLTSLDLSNFNTGNVTNMKNMFIGCNKLTTTMPIHSNAVTTYTNMFSNSANDGIAQITLNYTTDTSDLVDLMIATKSETSNVVKGSEITAPVEENLNITATVNKDESGIVTGVYLVTQANNAISSITVLNSDKQVVKEITLNGETTYSEMLDITDAGTYKVILKNTYNQKSTVTFEI